MLPLLCWTKIKSGFFVLGRTVGLGVGFDMDCCLQDLAAFIEHHDLWELVIVIIMCILCEDNQEKLLGLWFVGDFALENDVTKL